MPAPKRQPDPALITAAVAIACIGNLVALTVLGILESLPRWGAVSLVVGELLAPFIVYNVLKRSRRS